MCCGCLHLSCVYRVSHHKIPQTFHYWFNLWFIPPTVGSTHNIAITDDLDEGFRDLAEQRHGAAGIAITEQKPETFNFEEIKQHLDEEGDEPLIQF